MGFIESKFGHLSGLFNQLPDTRTADCCRYTPAELVWPVLLMFLTRMGSRNQMDAARNSGGLPLSVAKLAGRKKDDLPADGQRRVTCSDNAMLFLKRLNPQELEALRMGLVRELLKSRLFDASRVLGSLHRIVLDGSVHEKCRKGFEDDGKTNGSAQYRYVLQATLLLFGYPIPLMEEHIDVVDPALEKEDCEINAAKRLLPRIKQAFPRLGFIVIGDALYACRPIAALCASLGWRFCFTFKEGRTPAVWAEAITLMDTDRRSVLGYQDKPDSDPDRRVGRVRWAGHLDFSEEENGSLMATAIEQTTPIPNPL